MGEKIGPSVPSANDAYKCHSFMSFITLVFVFVLKTNKKVKRMFTFCCDSLKYSLSVKMIGDISMFDIELVQCVC